MASRNPTRDSSYCARKAASESGTFSRVMTYWSVSAPAIRMPTVAVDRAEASSVW